MFADQIVKLEDNRIPSIKEKPNKCGPFKLSRSSSEGVESYEKKG